MDLWSEVRNHFVSDLRGVLERLGIKVTGAHGSDWLSVVCPHCDDEKGSASCSLQSAFLKCFKCSAADDLFAWYAKKSGLTGRNPDWEACKLLAADAGIEVATKKQGRPTKKLTGEIVDRAIAALWDDPDAEKFRVELANRGFNAATLAPYYIGYHNGSVIFPQCDTDGAVHPRAHRWLGPWAGRAKWIWTPGQENIKHFWPGHMPPPDDATILLVGGEWDVLAVRELAKLQGQGFYAYTWTGGESTPLLAGCLPHWLEGKRVIVSYDNDTWQGPDLNKFFAPEKKRMRDGLRRRRNVLEGVCWVLERFGCKEVLLATNPIPATKQWGADIRDWIAKGGKNFDEWKLTPFGDVKDPEAEAIPTTLDKVVRQHFGKMVRFNAVVSGILGDDFSMPDRTRIECDMGQHNFCNRCQLPKKFPNATIDWSDRLETYFACLFEKDFREAVLRRVIGKPSACSFCELHQEHDSFRMGVRWFARADASDGEGEKEELIVSESVPDFGERVIVEGRAMRRLDSVKIFIAARKVSLIEREPFDYTDFVPRFMEHCPHGKTDVEAIDDYLYFQRHEDLAANVTNIYNRPEFHIAFDLVAHSALRFELEGRPRRGWLDANLTGVTRCGKSETVRRLHEHYGNLGALVSVQGNWTLAGMLAGNEQGPTGQYRLKPGLFPKCHGKMLVLDEFHYTNQGASAKQKLMPSLQEARDTGIANIVKIAQSRKLRAAVRLLTIANPIGRGFSNTAYPCEMLLKLYGSPEALSRVDFAVLHTAKADDPGMYDPYATITRGVHTWTSELCHALLRRSWDMPADRIHIEPDSVEAAKKIIADWHERMDSSIPLFTGPEKLLSLLRVAIACANLCFSHPEGKHEICLVRKEHVEWAQAWIEHLWVESGYEDYSQSHRKNISIRKPLHAEWGFLIHAGKDPDEALNVLQFFYAGRPKSALCAMLRLDIRDLDKWIGMMMRLNVVSIDNEREPIVYLTEQGSGLLRKLIHLVDEEPGKYRERFRTLDLWTREGGSTPSLFPLAEVDDVPT